MRALAQSKKKQKELTDEQKQDPQGCSKAKKKQKELTGEQKQDKAKKEQNAPMTASATMLQKFPMPTNVTQGCSRNNGLGPHASVPRPAGLVQDCEELWRNYDMLTDMRPSCVEPKPAPFGVGTTIDGAGCGEVSGSCKVPTSLLSAKQEVAGLRPGSRGLRPGSDGLRPESDGLRPGSGDAELLVLDEVEPQADLMSISQESANAQDRWAVTKVRMQMKMQCRKSDVNLEEFKQF
jgi:hypothetical protein